MEPFLIDILIAVGMGFVGAVLFSAIGLVSGTDEASTIAPLTLLVVMLNVPPVAVFTFFIAASVAKHITHAIPTALLGIPGDTLAVPMVEDARTLRNLGVPHIALRKMVSGGVIAAFLSVPLAVGFAVVLAPFEAEMKLAAPWLFAVAAVVVAYRSTGRWASVAALVPFVFIIVALQNLTAQHEVKLFVCYFMGIAIGPLVGQLFALLSPGERKTMERDAPREFRLAPDVRSWSGYFPNPFKVLDRTQIRWSLTTATISSATFVFSPAGMTVLLGEVVGSRIKHAYQRLTTVLSARNAVTESTYVAEVIIPLLAFGLPLSPAAVGVAAPLFNAPPRFTADLATGEVNNLHNMMSSWEFLGYGLVAVAIAALVAYPFSMNYAHRAASAVARKLSHEAIIGTFVGLIVVIGIWEGGLLGLLVILTMGLMGALLHRVIGLGAGVQFMGYYMAVLTIPTVAKLLG